MLCLNDWHYMLETYYYSPHIIEELIIYFFFTQKSTLHEVTA